MSELTYLSLGTNLGDREANIRRAVELIKQRVGEVVRCSSLHVTEPWGFSSFNLFVNAAIAVQTELSPWQLLETTQQIEREMGRQQKSSDGIYHDRIIDIDILLYGDLTLSTPTLIIPHPHMQEREFVQKPLQEILDTKSSIT